ncbi:MAG: hypothetical protein R3C01_18355 [Planctomycetaceae bacterium]
MSLIQAHFSDSDRQRVNQAIREAEGMTAAEIVPVIARSSGRYDRAEDMVGLWFAAFAIGCVWMLYPTPSHDASHWGTPSATWQLVALLAAGGMGFLVGAILGTRIDGLRRLFTPKAQMSDEVQLRARSLFFDQRVHHTAGQTGIVLYLSMYERTAAIIADQRIVDALGQQHLDLRCQELTQRLKVASLIDALCETTKQLGIDLSKSLPRSSDDINELPDALVLID